MKRTRRKPRKYTAFFEANEHGGYTVTVHALPGLVTEGKDLKHARAMAKDAIRCYIEGSEEGERAHPSRARIRAVQDFCRGVGGSPAPHPCKGSKDGAPSIIQDYTDHK
jgi:predicted RNase H-like HicB family nuclease